MKMRGGKTRFKGESDLGDCSRVFLESGKRADKLARGNTTEEKVPER